MKRKRLLALALAVLLGCGLAACTTTDATPDGTATKAATAAPTQAAADTPAPAPTAVTRGVELTAWAGQLAAVEDFETNRFTAYYEELTGVHINWIPIPAAEVGTKFNLSISSGDYPDMYMCASFSTTAVKQCIDAGILIAINDYLDYAPNYANLLSIDSDMKEAMTAPDGNIYSFVRYPGDSFYTTSHKLWIFKPWLDASGLGMPSTLDELKDVLVYFRDHDMNGNGDDGDELPCMGTYKYMTNASDPMVPVIDCFELVTDRWLKADDSGSISMMAVTDDYRAGLRYANMLYEEGLVAEETYVQDLNTFRSVTSVSSDNEVIVGVCGGPNYARFVTQSVYADAYKNYVYIPPLKKDVSSAPQTLYQPIFYQQKSLITATCEYPEAAVAWQDLGLDPEVTVIASYGYEGEHWTRVSENSDTGIVFQLTDKKIYPEGSSVTNEVWLNWTLPYYQGVLRLSYTQQYEDGTDDYYRNENESGAQQAYLDVATSDGLPLTVWCDDDDLLTEYTELSALINDYIKQAYTEFIIGTRDIDNDADWQAYMDELDAMGLDRYLEVAEGYYFGE